MIRFHGFVGPEAIAAAAVRASGSGLFSHAARTASDVRAIRATLAPNGALYVLFSAPKAGGAERVYRVVALTERGVVPLFAGSLHRAKAALVRLPRMGVTL